MTTQSFVRKNELTLTVTIPGTQPNSVSAHLSYKALDGTNASATISLTYMSPSWTGGWDSTGSGQGTVYWVAYGSGGVQPAAQGSFEICANAANTV